MYRVLTLFAILCWPGLAAAQTSTPQTKVDMLSQVTAQAPDNTSGIITPAILRGLLDNMVASYQQYASVNAQTGTTYAFVVGDYGKLVTFDNVAAVAVTLPQAVGTFSTFNVYVKNNGAGAVTITPTVSTINGAATLVLAQGANAWIISDGANYQVFISAATGTVTSVGSGTGLTGGPITTSGTLALANMAANTVKANPTGGAAAPTDTAMPSCSTAGQALNWTASTGFTCQTIAVAASSSLCGASGLVISNNAAVPNTSIDVSWRQLTLLNTTGAAILSDTPASVTIDATASGAVNQWDASRSNNNWGEIWLISNGTLFGALGSTSSNVATKTAPTLPAGYTYSCYVGSVRWDVASNLYRTQQHGRTGQYVMGAGGTGASTPLAANGTAGTFDNNNPVLVAAQVRGMGKCVPPTATRLSAIMVGSYAAGTTANVLLAPDFGYSGAGNGPGGANGVLSFSHDQFSVFSTGAEFDLESNNVWWASSASGGAVGCIGWQDAVNAN